MTELRHPHSNPDAPTQTGITTYQGNSPSTGCGITRSCDKCLQHRVQALGTYFPRPKVPGQARARPAWYCAACAQERLRKQLCTCDGAGCGPGRACIVKSGGRLGKLWRCADNADTGAGS